MLHRVLTIALLCMLTIALTGCGGSRSARPQAEKNPLDDWTEWNALTSEGKSGNFIDSDPKEELKQIISIAKSPEFQSALTAFESSEVPTGLEPKQSAIDTFVEKLKAIVEEVNGGKDKTKIRGLFTESFAAYSEILK